MKNATGELGDRTPRKDADPVVPQAVAEQNAIREAREKAAKDRIEAQKAQK